MYNIKVKHLYGLLIVVLSLLTFATEKNKQMKFSTEITTNPNVMKFVTSENIFSETNEYNSSSTNITSPVINKLLTFPFVQSVLTSMNFIAIEKNDTMNWEAVNDELKELLDEELPQELMAKTQKVAVTVYAEMTPNPNVMKFVSNVLLYDQIAEAKNSTETENFPLAKTLFTAFDMIDEVFLAENYVSITKKENTLWEENAMIVREFISQYLRDGKEIITANYRAKKPVLHTENTSEKREFSSTEKEIQKILEEYVKPAVNNDGGNIELIAFDEKTKTAKMLLQGACSGCPSSTMTLKNGIQSILQQMLPNQIENVEAINE